MDFFNSPWLVSMLSKASSSPDGRLLSLFDILDDWMHAPHVKKISNIRVAPCTLLIHFCSEQARALGAENPDILAEHIVLIALNAAQQTLDMHMQNLEPCTTSDIHYFSHAKKAAHALITAQTQKPSRLSLLVASKPARYGITACVMLALGAITALSLPELMHKNQTNSIVAEPTSAPEPPLLSSAQIHLSAHDATQMYAKYELMRKGTCQFPEALHIPDAHKAIYLDSVVGGKLPANLADLQIANTYLDKVRCNFTPMLMAASK
jgi:hypothetical protein